jgi:hypothetical protein
MPELRSFRGWYSSSAWGQLPAATSLSDPHPYPTSPGHVATQLISQQTCDYVRYSVGDPENYLAYEQVRSSVQVKETFNSQAQGATVSEQKFINSTAVLSVQLQLSVQCSALSSLVTLLAKYRCS